MTIDLVAQFSRPNSNCDVTSATQQDGGLKVEKPMAQQYSTTMQKNQNRLVQEKERFSTSFVSKRKRIAQCAEYAGKRIRLKLNSETELRTNW